MANSASRWTKRSWSDLANSTPASASSAAIAASIPQRGDHRGPLVGREHRDHEALAVAAVEIAPERAPDRVAEPRAVGAAIEHLGHRARIGDRADRHVAQRHAHFAALAGRVAVVHRGQQREGAIGAGEEVPCGQHLVDRRGAVLVPVLRAGHQRIAAGGVDGEIHRLPPVVPAHDADRDQVGPTRAHRVVAEEALFGQVGDELAGRRLPVRHSSSRPSPGRRSSATDFLARLRFSHASAAALGGQHVAIVVQPAADLVDPDHLGPHLRAVEPAVGEATKLDTSTIERSERSLYTLRRTLHENADKRLARGPQGQPPARSDAILDHVSEDFARRMACGHQELAANSRSMCLAICSWRICVVPS